MQLAKCFEGAEETFFSKRELELEDRTGEHRRTNDDETKHNKKQRGEKLKKKKKKKWASCTRDTRFAMRSTYIFI